MAFSSDVFTDTNGTNLSAHTDDLGNAWTAVAGSITIESNRIVAAGGGGVANYSNAGAPATNEYDVSLDLVWVTSAGDMGVWGRWTDTASYTGYLAQHDQAAGQWRLFKASSGSFTSLGTFADSFTSGTKTLKLEIRSAAKKLFVDGVERVSSADDAITGTGVSGVRGGLQSSTTGRHGDNFVAEDPAGGGGATVPALDEGMLVGGLQSMSGGL